MPTAGAKHRAGSDDLRGSQPASLAWPGLSALQTPGKRLRHIAVLRLSHQHEDENSSNLELILQMNIFQFPKFGSPAFVVVTLVTRLFFHLNRQVEEDAWLSLILMQGKWGLGTVQVP